jgi:cupin 2 domain-containing protein
MKVRPGNLFQGLPLDAAEEVQELILGEGDVRIERIVSRGQSSPASGWYDQDRDEWVVVLRGRAILLMEDGQEFWLEEGDYLNIPAHARHRVAWTDPMVETVWLAVHYG